MEFELERQLKATERNIYIKEGQYIKETANFGKLYNLL